MIGVCRILSYSKNPWLWDKTTISQEIVLVLGFHEAFLSQHQNGLMNHGFLLFHHKHDFWSAAIPIELTPQCLMAFIPLKMTRFCGIIYLAQWYQYLNNLWHGKCFLSTTVILWQRIQEHTSAWDYANNGFISDAIITDRFLSKPSTHHCYIALSMLYRLAQFKGNHTGCQSWSNVSGMNENNWRVPSISQILLK